MQRRLRVLLVLAVVLSRVATAASGQGPLAVARFYRLSERSTYQSGCFPPCLCPNPVPVAVRGIFKLTPTGFDGLFNTFAVSDVSWIASVGGNELLITGSGTYRIGGEFALEQRLELDLVIDGSPVQHLDSGFVPTDGAQFPAINVTVSINQMVCQDTVIVLDAAPIPLNRMLRYRLVAPSTFQQGCGLDPASFCLCPAGPQLPIRGTFRLVPLLPEPLFNDFAVIDVRWRVPTAATPGPDQVIRITGAGFYKVGGEVAVEQQLALDLAIGGAAPVHLDSGLLGGGGAFPARIDVTLSTGGCFETHIDVHAAQGPPLAGLRVR